MTSIFAAYCNNSRIQYNPAGEAPGGTVIPGIRKGDGVGNWVDISKPLTDYATQTAITKGGNGSITNVRFYILDMYFIRGALWVLWSDDYSAISGVSVFSGSTWRHLSTVDTESVPAYTGFFCWNRQPYIYGNSNGGDGERGLTIYSINGSNIVSYARDSTRALGGLYLAWRGCAILSSKLANTLIVGDAYEDNFAYVDLNAKTFHPGSDPGGSCIFAMGIDNNKDMWTGNYANFYYRSTDGGLTFNRTGQGVFAGLPDNGLCEPWEMKRWKNNLYGVGCNPCSIIKRNEATGSGSKHFDVVATYPDLGLVDGTGFMSFQPVGGDLIIGFGSEPYYYLRQGTHGKVYRYTAAGELHDISGGLNWGDGVHQVCDQTRSCRPNIISGDAGDGGVRYDNVTDTSSRMLASPKPTT